MLKLKELWRQILAGLLAASAFSLSYLGLSLVWWVALLIGLAVYAAALLLIERAPEANEVYVHANLTQADLNNAVQQCQQAATELQQASQTAHIDSETAHALTEMAQIISEIGRNYAEDPLDLKHSRSFISHYLPKILTVVRDYVSLSERSVTATSQQRLKEVGKAIQAYLPHVQTIHNACLANDFERLELETAVLGDILRLDNPVSEGAQS